LQQQLNRCEKVGKIMSYDRIWIQRSRQPGEWLERNQAQGQNKSGDFEDHLQPFAYRGTLRCSCGGKNNCFDELFLFETSTDAETFYKSGFKEWESFIEDDDEGCGFQEVALYQSGQRIESKSREPSTRIEVRHE
jgi:hypothetical protein